ncbi:hypothetical protein HOY80DRAFT_994810, partial [Tuber brumale]
MGGPTWALSYKALKTTAATMLAVRAQCASFLFGSCGLASASFRFLRFASASGGLASVGSLFLFFCLAFGPPASSFGILGPASAPPTLLCTLINFLCAFSNSLCFWICSLSNSFWLLKSAICCPRCRSLSARICPPCAFLFLRFPSVAFAEDIIFRMVLA